MSERGPSRRISDRCSLPWAMDSSASGVTTGTSRGSRRTSTSRAKKGWLMSMRNSRMALASSCCPGRWWATSSWRTCSPSETYTTHQSASDSTVSRATEARVHSASNEMESVSPVRARKRCSASTCFWRETSRRMAVSTRSPSTSIREMVASAGNSSPFLLRPKMGWRSAILREAWGPLPKVSRCPGWPPWKRSGSSSSSGWPSISWAL
jgi:hypothetical protein